MYLLDTNVVTQAFAGHERVLARLRRAPAGDVWLSSVAAEESLQGALSLINWSRDKPTSPDAHDFLTRLLSALCEYQVCPYDDDAAHIFASFPAQVKRIGTQDCRIAASAISRGWVVITANRKDFSKIPGVQSEDWSR